MNKEQFGRAIERDETLATVFPPIDWGRVLVGTARELFALTVAQGGEFDGAGCRAAANASVLAATELVDALRARLGVRGGGR